MQAVEQSIIDKLEIDALVARYAWALDTNNIADLDLIFTDDAVITDTSGNRYEGRDAAVGYLRTLAASAPFRGRQHLIYNMILSPTADGYDARSYWTVTQWLTGKGTKEVVAVGHSIDGFRKVEGKWKWTARHLHHWKDSDCPWNEA